jgi:DNA-binding response OmpR family regulator
MTNTPTPPSGRRTVLVCNSEPTLRLLVRGALGHEYRVLESADGAAALATIRAQQPDLILLDTMLPRLSGSDVLAAVRSDPAVAATPVIMLTAREQTALDKDAAATAHYLMKPFSPFELATFVGALLVDDELPTEHAAASPSTRTRTSDALWQAP